MREQRRLTDVIDQLLGVIPEKHSALIAELSDIRSSAEVAAPELQYLWWQETADRLAESIPNLKDCHKWHNDALAIFMNQSGRTKHSQWRQLNPKDQLTAIMQAVEGHTINLVSGVTSPQEYARDIKHFHEMLNMLGQWLPESW